MLPWCFDIVAMVAILYQGVEKPASGREPALCGFCKRSPIAE
jgi:hypothetical protein